MGSKNSAYRNLSIKAAAVLSTAVTIHLFGPSIARFASSEIPRIYASMISWLAPPYLYFVINGIIISIAASSRFHKSGSDGDGVVVDVGVGSGSGIPAAAVKQQDQYLVVSAPAPVEVEEVVKVGYVAPPEYVNDDVESTTVTVAAEKPNADEEEEEEEFVIRRSSWTPRRRREEPVTEMPPTEKETVAAVLEIPPELSFLADEKEKPLVSARLGRRKSITKNSPEVGRGLGVARPPRRNDTLESTWRAITDGRAVPLNRHLKKSDTWETHHARDPEQQQQPPPHLMRKSDTFRERGAEAVAGQAAARLKKEPSLGQDDLNRRVEAFINKFNEEMRLQRQESFRQYLDMINRGSH